MKRKNKSYYLQGSKRSQLVLAVVLIACLVCVSFVLWWIYENTSTSKSPTITQPETTTLSQPQETNETVEEVIEEPADFDSTKLQSVLDAWTGSIDGADRASVELMSIDGEIIASVNSQEAYFTASIYKLYVAYEGYRQVDAGEVDPSDAYVGSSTRGECLDLMIRESDSPCAEALWNELGKDTVTQTLVGYGLEATSLVGLSTTAHDAAVMTARIARGEGLSEVSKSAFHESMKTQIFRNTLNKGFSSSITVYNKIGFNQQLEYHDVGFIELTDGRELVVSVLTSGVGTKKIAELATELEKVL